MCLRLQFDHGQPKASGQQPAASSSQQPTANNQQSTKINEMLVCGLWSVDCSSLAQAWLEKA
jgi:hypothetical protein